MDIKTEPYDIVEMEHETLNAILNGEAEKVKSLYSKVEELFVQGGEHTRNLIANNFILPLTLLLEMNYSWGREYLNMFPKNLRMEYCRQINCSGI